MRSFILISISVVLFVLGRSISSDSDQLKRVVWHHDNDVMMRDISSYQSLFSQFEKKFGFYPKHYERLDSLHLKYINQQKSLTRNQLRELNALCDSLNVDCKHLTIPMKLNRCLSIIEIPPRKQYFERTRDIMVTEMNQTDDSLTLMFALFEKLVYDEKVRINYFLDSKSIDTSLLVGFEGDTDQLSVQVFNLVTDKTNTYSFK